MKKARTILRLDQLQLNEGQLDWLGRNPRKGTQEDIDKCVQSLLEDPDWLEDKPLSVVPAKEPDQYVVFIGNLRTTSAPIAGLTEMPAIIYTPEKTPDPDKDGKLTFRVDRETIIRRALKDNGTFGHWDFDELPNWGVPADVLASWGVETPEWFRKNDDAQRQMENGGLSSDGMEQGEGYQEFVDKFKQKLTTDDCFTPPAVYDIVRDFVNESVAPLENRKIVRPFYPGGDYENEKYPEGCVVIDNPPFSILSKILRFFCEQKIDFFLFGPQLTLFSAHELQELTYLPICAPVTYENGAVVSTGFITNMKPGVKVWIPAGFRHRIIEVQRDVTPIDEYKLPTCVITSSRLGVISGVEGGSLEIPEGECCYIKNLDDMAARGKGLYGGGGI